MASAPISPPATTQDSQGPGAGGGFSSPAPAVDDPRSSTVLRSIMDVVAGMRMIANQYPAAVPEVRQINDLLAKIQGKIKQSQPTPEAQAPPV